MSKNPARDPVIVIRRHHSCLYNYVYTVCMKYTEIDDYSYYHPTLLLLGPKNYMYRRMKKVHLPRKKWSQIDALTTYSGELQIAKEYVQKQIRIYHYNDGC